MARVRRLAAAGHPHRVVPPPRWSAWQPTCPSTRPSPIATATTRPTRRPSIGGIGMLTGGARRQPRPRGARRRARVHQRRARRGARARRTGVGDGAPRVERSTTSTCSCASATCTPTARRYNVCDALQRYTPDDDRARRRRRVHRGVRALAHRSPVRRGPPAPHPGRRAGRTPSTHGTSAPASPPPRPSTWWPTTSPSTTQPTGRHSWCCPTSPEVTTRSCAQAAGQAGILLLRRSSPTATNADET